MGAVSGNAAVVQDQDLVGVLYGRDALGDDDDGGILQIGGEGLADGGLCGAVHSGGGVVQNEHRRLSQHGPGNAQPLFLSAGDVGAALGKHGVEAIGQAP